MGSRPQSLILLYRAETPAPITVLPFSAFRRRFVTFFTDRKLRATAPAGMAPYVAFGAFATCLKVGLHARGMGAYQTGIVFAAQTLIVAATKPTCGRIAGRIDKRIHVVIGLFVLGCSVAVIPFASGFAA